MGSSRFISPAEHLRCSLRLRYARFDTCDLCSTETSGSTFVLGTRDTLRPNGTLDVGDWGGCGQPSLTGFGSHGCCMKEDLEELEELEERDGGRRMKKGLMVW